MADLLVWSKTVVKLLYAKTEDLWQEFKYIDDDIKRLLTNAIFVRTQFTDLLTDKTQPSYQKKGVANLCPFEREKKKKNWSETSMVGSHSFFVVVLFLILTTNNSFLPMNNFIRWLKYLSFAWNTLIIWNE